MSKQSYGQRVRAARQAAGLTLREMAERCGCHFTTIAHVQQDRFTPSFRLCEAFGVACEVDLMPDDKVPFARLLLAAEDVYNSHYSWYGVDPEPHSPMAELGKALRDMGRAVAA